MATPLAPVITPPGQYTRCVERENYRGIPGLLDEGAPSILQFLLCEYLLGGKLVCLAGAPRCAIGVVVGLEPVGSKSEFDAIDNDFSFNVLLAPFEPHDFAHYGKPTAKHVVDPRPIYHDVSGDDKPQGPLLKDPHPHPPLPDPLDQTGSPVKAKLDRKTAAWPMDGYGVPWKTDGVHVTDIGAQGDNLHVFVDDAIDDTVGVVVTDIVPLVVMHCECEGSRMSFVCQALKPFLDALTGQIPGVPFNPGKACHAVAKRLPWGLDKVAHAGCTFLENTLVLPIALALAPAMAAAFAAAWEAAQAFDDLFVTAPVARQIHVGDLVIVNGRWVWDAGHSGQTELHPVTSIQKLQAPPLTLPAEVRPPGPTYDPREHLDPVIASRLRARYGEWCRLVSEPPPLPDPRTGRLSGPQLAALTAEQRALNERQQLPENGWEVHPMLDGCHPSHEAQTGSVVLVREEPPPRPEVR